MLSFLRFHYAANAMAQATKGQDRNARAHDDISYCEAAKNITYVPRLTPASNIATCFAHRLYLSIGAADDMSTIGIHDGRRTMIKPGGRIRNTIYVAARLQKALVSRTYDAPMQ